MRSRQQAAWRRVCRRSAERRLGNPLCDLQDSPQPPCTSRLLQRIRPSCLPATHGVFLQLNYGFLSVAFYKRGRSSPASAESQSLQRTPLPQQPPTPCKPCRAGRIKPSLPNRTLLRARRIVKTTSRREANGALKPSYKGCRSKRQGYTVGVLHRNTIPVEVLLPLIISICFY